MLFYLAVLLQPVAASDAIDRAPTWFHERSVEETFASAPLVLVATVESLEDVVWLGGAGNETAQSVRMTVDLELKGHVQSGTFYYWNSEFQIEFEAGQRVIVFGGPKVQQVGEYSLGTRPPFEGLPHFGDIVVPMWHSSVIRDDFPSTSALAPSARDSHMCFRNGEFERVHEHNDNGDFCSEAEWNALLSWLGNMHSDGVEEQSIPGALP